VVAVAQVPVMVGASGTRAAVVGSIPNAATTEDEVHAFVRSLLNHGQLQLGKTRALAAGRSVPLPTHDITTVGGKKVLRRLRFNCGVTE
jgi:hypothetical protein